MASEVLLTNEIKGYFEAKSDTIAAVASVELSFTTTTFVGKTVCSTKDCRVSPINSSSLWEGITM
jgi:hypothetical protein